MNSLMTTFMLMMSSAALTCSLHCISSPKQSDTETTSMEFTHNEVRFVDKRGKVRARMTFLPGDGTGVLFLMEADKSHLRMHADNGGAGAYLSGGSDSSVRLIAAPSQPRLSPPGAPRGTPIPPLAQMTMASQGYSWSAAAGLERVPGVWQRLARFDHDKGELLKSIEFSLSPEEPAAIKCTSGNKTAEFLLK